MKIIQLTAENIKKLTAVEIKPDGNVVQITGKNGQGKTSVLDSIWWALAGSDHIQSRPIRNGADKARIELKLGSGETVDLVVERRFSEKSSSLSVMTANGAKYPKPQSMLDDLFGALTFDPLDFMRRDAKGQFAVLKDLVPLDIDLDEAAQADRADYKQRTILNRDAEAMRAQAAAVVVSEDLPDARIDDEALLRQMADASLVNSAIARRKAQVDALRRDIDALRRSMAEAEAALQECLAEPFQEPVDVEGLRSEIERARQINRSIEMRDRRKTAEQEAEALEAKSKALTKAIEDRARERTEALARAKMPVEGLSFGDGMVTFNGLPLDQASDAEQLTISTAIAAALNPKLRVIRIRDGSLLDDDAMTHLARFADTHDMQIWIERVDGSGTVGVVMEDGHVRAATAPAEPEQPVLV